MGPVALLVFKTSAPANTGLVSSTLTRLRHYFGKLLAHPRHAVPSALCANNSETPAPLSIRVEGGEDNTR